MNYGGINDTIAAIATPIGAGGIGIVRISGKDAFSIADEVFVSKDKLKPSGFKSHTLHYGWIKDSAKTIDEVMLTVMRAPRTYTKEDIVEINCHGGIVALRQVLDLMLAKGCRLAQGGEFTKRAFLNGRIDLSQAEAVLDIIRAKTDAGLKVGLRQLAGGLSVEINAIGATLVEALSFIEAHIDFPEEEIQATGISRIRDGLMNADKALKEILRTAHQGKIVREGVHLVICGKPNVGKSSLLNALLKEERSIVTPVAGTTRDTIEEVFDIQGIPVRIVDTAGILEPRDLIERKAVARSKKQIELADLVLLLFDGSKKVSREDKMLIKKVSGKPAIAVINKIDLPQRIDKDPVARAFLHTVGISAKKRKNIRALEEAIVDILLSGNVCSADSIVASNCRHIAAINDAQILIAEARKSLDNNLSWEFVAQGIREAMEKLDCIVGRKFSEKILDKIFSEFCIGK